MHQSPTFDTERQADWDRGVQAYQALWDKRNHETLECMLAEQLDIVLQGGEAAKRIRRGRFPGWDF